MRLLLSISFLTLFLFWGCGQKQEAQSKKQVGTDMQMDTTAEMVIYYTCPMEEHKHVHSAKAGKCPECNMDLVAAVITTEDKMEFYGCPMEEHSHVRSENPGECAECDMTLKPMRLVKL